MCLSDVIMVICDMVFDIAPVFWMLDEENVMPLLLTRFLIAGWSNRSLQSPFYGPVAYIREYTLHQSRDLIRRRYTTAMIPFYRRLFHDDHKPSDRFLADRSL